MVLSLAVASVAFMVFDLRPKPQLYIKWLLACTQVPEETRLASILFVKMENYKKDQVGWVNTMGKNNV